MSKYKLNVTQDVDTDEPGVFIHCLPGGWKFDHDLFDLSHTHAYDSMKELKAAIKDYVVPCDCKECLSMIAKTWKHNAPLNPEFLGAQPAQASQDY